MAAGVPIVATAGGGVAEMVRHEENGLLYPVKDVDGLTEGVLRLIREDELASRLIQGASRTVRNFSKEKTAKRTVEVYQEILNEKSRSD